MVRINQNVSRKKVLIYSVNVAHYSPSISTHHQLSDRIFRNRPYGFGWDASYSIDESKFYALAQIALYPFSNEISTWLHVTQGKDKYSIDIYYEVAITSSYLRNYD